MRLTAFLILGLLAACSGGEEDAAPPEQNRQNPPAEARPAPPPQAAPAKAHLTEETSDLLEFTYGWPAEAAAIPKLNARFQADLERKRKEAMATAREDKEARGADAPYNGHDFSQVWETQGQTARLLSLAADLGTFTGGAHGNSIYQALLWDRGKDAPVELKDLFANPGAAFAAMMPIYCKELNGQRAEKRQGEDMAGAADWMVQCRPIAEQIVAPVDADKDGRFELFRVLLEPYNAGPYAEGTYEVDVPVTDLIRKLLKPEYSTSF